MALGPRELLADGRYDASRVAAGEAWLDDILRSMRLKSGERVELSFRGRDGQYPALNVYLNDLDRKELARRYQKSGWRDVRMTQGTVILFVPRYRGEGR